jgi:hypothetical protein
VILGGADEVADLKNETLEGQIKQLVQQVKELERLQEAKMGQIKP